MAQTFNDIAWVKEVLAETEYADSYPFLRFFSKPLQDVDKLRGLIVAANKWIEGKSPMGLIISGPSCPQRSHLLYLIAYAKDMRIVNARDIISRAMEKNDDGSSRWELTIKQFADPRHAIDFLGEEKKMENSPVKDIIYQMWKNGEGLVAGTALGKGGIIGQYGEDAYSMIQTSCEIIKWPE